MRTLYNSLKEITPKTREWKLKVVVAEKIMARSAIHSPNKYQRLILADTEGNRIQATIFGRDIQLFAETLHISNTYYIINALVKPIKPEHRIVQNEFQWTINSKTVIELASENEIQLPTLGLDFVPFTDFHKYINSLSQIDVIAVAIDAQAPRELQTKNGTTIIQELTLVDQDLKPICLTMWDHFVENESAMISNDIKSKPIIIGARLKVVSHNGMSLSTKSSSSFIINPNSSEANALHNWAIANESVLNDIIQNKSYLKASSSSTAASNRTITQIATIPELAKTQFSFWVKAKISVTNLQQTFWYMACNKCSRSTGVEADETFACLNCKETDAVAQPRCRVEVELHDASDSLVASLFGEDAEKFLECSATKLMLYSTEEGITNIQSLARLSSEEEFIIRLRAVLVDGRRGPRQRFNITTVQEPPNEDPSISATQ